MCPPSSSNTTQVLRRLLCQRGLEKEAEFSDITCCGQLPGQPASGCYQSHQKAANQTTQVSSSSFRAVPQLSDNLQKVLASGCCSLVVCIGCLVLTEISVNKISVDGKKKTPHTVEKHSAILKHPVVCVDVCFAAMAPAFLQVLAELLSEALQ